MRLRKIHLFSLVLSLILGISLQESKACTSLIIKDKKGNVYHGRTMELNKDYPFDVTYYPKGTNFKNTAPDGTQGLEYTTKYSILGVTAPLSRNSKVMLEGVNSGGLSFSENMISSFSVPDISKEEYSRSLTALAVGEWALANFQTIKDVKEAVKDLKVWSPVFTGELARMGYAQMRVHFVFYDTTGASLVVEYMNKQLYVYDNPTGVMTNGPEFSWHLTNMNNYTQLTNIDVSKTQLGGLNLTQPDTGIATSILPSSDTSVGRFIRASFYSNYALEKDTPEEQIIELSHIMNKFDRPKNMTVSKSGEGNPSVEKESSPLTSEYTLWTALTNIQTGDLWIRSYDDLQYEKFSLKDFEKENKTQSMRVM